MQRHELDIYRTNGEPVAVGLPIEGVRAPSAMTTVWQVELPTVESTQ